MERPGIVMLKRLKRKSPDNEAYSRVVNFLHLCAKGHWSECRNCRDLAECRKRYDSIADHERSRPMSEQNTRQTHTNNTDELSIYWTCWVCRYIQRLTLRTPRCEILICDGCGIHDCDVDNDNVPVNIYWGNMRLCASCYRRWTNGRLP